MHNKNQFKFHRKNSVELGPGKAQRSLSIQRAQEKRSIQNIQEKQKLAKKENLQYKQTQDEQEKLLYEISKLNKIIRNKSQLIKKRFKAEDSDKKIQTSRLIHTNEPIFKFEKEYNQKYFEDLKDAIRKQKKKKVLSLCFPEIVYKDVAKNQQNSSRFNIQKILRLKVGQAKSVFLNHKQSIKTANPEQEKQRTNYQLCQNWESLFGQIINEDSEQHIFVYVLINAYPFFVGYINYRIKELQSKNTSDTKLSYIYFTRIYIVEGFRIQQKQDFIKNMFKSCIVNLSIRKIKVYWTIKQNDLKKVERWGWKLANFKHREYTVFFDY